MNLYFFFEAWRGKPDFFLEHIFYQTINFFRGVKKNYNSLSRYVIDSERPFKDQQLLS